ncbi:MAG TPA: metal-dependent hydrolase [Candidatus Polarisedimenticolia bacterium]|nr:metal-dependent hydrolase [Candidatus Polarisedimenticolia bacterium]
MDNVTHTLSGVVLAHACYRRRLGPRAVPILAVAANLPDLDAVVMLSGDPRAVLLRRTFGHSLLLLPFWILLGVPLLRRLAPKLGFREVLALVAAGVGLHLLLDLVNSFGVVLLWPLSDWRPELASVFILDFILTGLLALPLLICLPRSRREKLEGAARASLALVAVYLLFCSLSRGLAGSILAREAASIHPPPEFSYVFPEPLGPHRWRGVLRQGNTYRLYLIHSLSGRIEPRRELTTQLGDLQVEAARASPPGRRVESFFKAPVWEVEARGNPSDIQVSDLRFGSLLLDREPVFVFDFEVYPDLRVEEAR